MYFILFESFNIVFPIFYAIMETSALQIPVEKLFSLLCSNANIGYWAIDFANNKPWWSDTCYEMLGIEDKNEKQTIEVFLEQTVHPEDRHLVTAAIKNYLHQNAVSNKTDVRLRNRKGGFNWYHLFSQAQYDENGKLLYIFGGISNIDEKKQKEEESEKLKFFVDVAEEMMGIGTFETNFITGERYWSKTVYDIVELPYDTKLHNLLREDFLDEKDLKNMTNCIEELRTDKKPVDLELRLNTAKENSLWVRIMAKPLFDENRQVTGMRGTVQKIEKQKLKENFLIDIRNKIKEQNFFLDETSSMSNVGGWELNLETNKLYWSTQTKLIHEVDENYEPAFDSAIAFYTPSSREILTEHFSKLLETEKPFDLELEMTTAGNNKIWVRKLGKPVINLSGKMITARGVIQNITEQKRKEIELNLSLSIINDQNSKLKDFTYIVSHNLRSHAGNLKMITDMVELETDVEVKLEWINLIKNVSASLSETVNNLNGLVSLNTEIKKEISFVETFGNIQKILSYKLMNEEVQIVTDFSECERINYVPAYLESIMLNLITNAIKYKHPERNAVISLFTSRHNNRPFLKVSDNGIGIDLEKFSSRLFKMNQTFHQNSDARGIGLYITKNQVENMGGSIEVESNVDEGTTFTIHF